VYASDMLLELTSAKIMVVEGTLYPLLTRLRKAELVNYRWEESTSGPPRKYYKLTDAGKFFLNQLTQTWEELMGSTNQIIFDPKNGTSGDPLVIESNDNKEEKSKFSSNANDI
nr:PadR family transcriptional regulator [Bacteroidota bacterium]